MAPKALAFGLAAAMLLAGCATPPAALPPQLQCLPLAKYSAEQQRQLEKEVLGLRSDSMLLRAMLDYRVLRGADRAACAALPT